MNTKTKLIGKAPVLFLAASILVAGCAGGSLTTREKGAGIGALGGAAAGGLIGSAVGRPGVGAAVGGGLGLGAGALIGDQLQGQENTNYQQQQQINRNQAEINRSRQEIPGSQRNTAPGSRSGTAIGKCSNLYRWAGKQDFCRFLRCTPIAFPARSSRRRSFLSSGIIAPPIQSRVAQRHEN